VSSASQHPKENYPKKKKQQGVKWKTDLKDQNHGGVMRGDRYGGAMGGCDRMHQTPKKDPILKKKTLFDSLITQTRKGSSLKRNRKTT